MRGDFAEEVGRVLGIERRDLIEKDLLLHQILLDLSKNEFFRRNFLFKGGTCLIKHYLGYYRFSEDIDFTWKNQKSFEGKSGKAARKLLSGLVDKTGEIFEKIANSRDLDFKCAKDDRRYVELVGSSRTLTFKIWYDSDILRRKTFTKVQVNFVDNLYFDPVEGELHNLLSSRAIDTKKLEFIYPELSTEYSAPIILDLYDIREILCEKARSILTRRGVKARDFVDAYLIFREKGVNLRELEGETIGKIQLMLDLYERFRNNFSKKMELLESGELFSWGEEKELLLSRIDEENFYRFVDTFNESLKEIGKKIKTQLQSKHSKILQ